MQLPRRRATGWSTGPAREKRVFYALVSTGLVALVPFVSWMVRGLARSDRPFLWGLCAAALLALPLFHLLMADYVLSRFRHRPERAAPEGLRVDVFVAAHDEPAWLVRRTLRAAVAMRYPHRTWLLDDGGRDDLRAVALEEGAGYFAREGRTGGKAGNVNAALAETDGEFVAIFDADHAPRPEFLDRTLGHFADPRVGFVQAMLSFSNAEDGTVPRASAEGAMDFYNLIQVGQDRLGAASLVGSNAVLRRAALDEVGSYRPGLAEDLVTSLALHAAGWRSAYVAEPLAPGLAPPDLEAFLRQQLKWSSGVFRAALRSSYSTFPRLTPHQKLCYLTRFTYYLIPIQFLVGMLLVALHLVRPFLDLSGLLAVAAAPLALFVLSCSYARRAWATEAAARRPWRLRASSLLAVSWPAYLCAALRVVLRRPATYLSTPKTPGGRPSARVFLPQLVVLLLLAATLSWRAVRWDPGAAAATGIALFQIASHWILVPALLRRPSPPLRAVEGDTADAGRRAA